ncbi:hypothetical protein [Bradyrhizobium guangxiense]|uniref:hypothetical protein n=1 Tax=Bradyrhizobium guangxiense TaxID=1325115 RepID=UPI001009202B|nr:hypothetical protein [Bradyrhizobium guangxiense]
MPIVRYVLFASAFVVALLFALDRSLPPPAGLAPAPGVDRSIIRIHSARTWPEKIIFDTSSQIATAVSSPLLAGQQSDDHADHALAMAAPQKPETKAPPASQPSAARTTSLRSKRTARAASMRRLYDRQAMVGAF